MNKRKIILFAALAVLLLAGCKKEKLDLSDGNIIGTWHKEGTAEYWLYNSDHTGCMYNTDQGFSASFPSFDYEWSVSGDQLWHIVDEQGVSYNRVYTVTKINSTTMVREEELETFTLTKQ